MKFAKGTAGTVTIDPGPPGGKTPAVTLTFPDPTDPNATSVNFIDFYNSGTSVTITANATTGTATIGGDATGAGNPPAGTVQVGPNDKSVTVTVK